MRRCKRAKDKKKWINEQNICFSGKRLTVFINNSQSKRRKRISKHEVDPTSCLSMKCNRNGREILDSTFFKWIFTSGCLLKYIFPSNTMQRGYDISLVIYPLSIMYAYKSLSPRHSYENGKLSNLVAFS